MVTFVVIFSIGEMVKDDKYLYHSNSNYDNFYIGRMVGNHLVGTVDSINNIIDK